MILKERSFPVVGTSAEDKEHIPDIGIHQGLNDQILRPPFAYVYSIDLRFAQAIPSHLCQKSTNKAIEYNEQGWAKLRNMINYNLT